MISIRKISSESTYFIRKVVLRNGLDLPCNFDGDFDDYTFHLGVFKQSKLVGIATCMQQKFDFLEGSQYQLRGMATLPEVRGEGLGNLLLKTVFEELKNRNVDFLWCNAREEAIKFYQKNGFIIEGNSFNIEEVGTHYKMYKKLK